MVDFAASLADTLRASREADDLSVTTLAARSGVSRAMITKIERGEAQPTAVLLSKLAAALGMTLSSLIARAEANTERVRRVADQPVWTDPESGYRRRAVSPAVGGPLELVEVELPAGAVAPFPAESYMNVHHQIWVLSGHLRFREGDTVHELDAGDCLQLGPPVPCAYINPTTEMCRYLVVIGNRMGRTPDDLPV